MRRSLFSFFAASGLLWAAHWCTPATPALSAPPRGGSAYSCPYLDQERSARDALERSSCPECADPNETEFPNPLVSHFQRRPLPILLPESDLFGPILPAREAFAPAPAANLNENGFAVPTLRFADEEAPEHLPAARPLQVAADVESAPSRLPIHETALNLPAAQDLVDNVRALLEAWVASLPSKPVVASLADVELHGTQGPKPNELAEQELAEAAPNWLPFTEIPAPELPAQIARIDATPLPTNQCLDPARMVAETGNLFQEFGEEYAEGPCLPLPAREEAPRVTTAPVQGPAPALARYQALPGCDDECGDECHPLLPQLVRSAAAPQARVQDIDALPLAEGEPRDPWYLGCAREGWYFRAWQAELANRALGPLCCPAAQPVAAPQVAWPRTNGTRPADSACPGCDFEGESLAELDLRELLDDLAPPDYLPGHAPRLITGGVRVETFEENSALWLELEAWYAELMQERDQAALWQEARNAAAAEVADLACPDLDALEAPAVLIADHEPAPAHRPGSRNLAQLLGAEEIGSDFLDLEAEELSLLLRGAIDCDDTLFKPRAIPADHRAVDELCDEEFSSDLE